MRSRRSQVPWRNERDAREFLGWLADSLVGAPRPAPTIDDGARLAAWLTRHDLGAPAYAAIGCEAPDLAVLLRPAALSTAAWNREQFDALDRIDRALAAAGIPVVLLKGAALAREAYGGTSRRPMSDLDLWIGPARIEDAVRVLRSIGYEEPRRSGDETQMRPPGRRRGLVELHRTAFRGAWVRWTAAVDEGALWRRAERADPERAARRLAAEDEILHLACHLVVNHLDQAPLRGLLDIALVARTRKPDWTLLASRATEWRIATAAWVALDRSARTFGLPGAERALERLEPSTPRRAALSSLARPVETLVGRVGPAGRAAVPLLCTDRARDALRLVARAAWPDRPWLVSRYGADAGRLAHLRALVGPGRS